MGFLSKLFGTKKEGRSAFGDLAGVSGVAGGEVQRSPEAAEISVRLEQIASVPTNVDVDIVGEAHYQDALNRIAGGKTEDGHCLPVRVRLQREPTNRYDRNAVMALMDGCHVGYINREAAAELQPFLRHCECNNLKMELEAWIVGGWRRAGGDEGSYGVKLEEPVRQESTDDSSDRRSVGMYAGHHYTEYVEMVKDLKRNGDYGAAETLLLRLIDAVEEEAADTGWGPAPWYYGELAIVYRKQKRYEDEVALLHRFLALPKACESTLGAKLPYRLAKAEALAAKKASSEASKE